MTTTLTGHDLAALHRCSQDGTLELQYQPEIDLATGGIVAMEGLLRWHHAQLGLLRPPSFLELAEDSGEINAIGQWVLREGAAEARVWAALREPALAPAPLDEPAPPVAQRRLWLNVSAGQLASPGFVAFVAETVEGSGLGYGALGLEVAESCILQLGASAVNSGTALHEAGVALAVDNSGSWSAVLRAIELLPVDAIKLGHRYVHGVGDGVGPDGEGDATVAAIIVRAHDCGMLVVAEGVQTWGEASRLTELGCDRAHGWLYASAQRADKARWLLRSGTGWTHQPLPHPRLPSDAGLATRAS